MKKQLFIIILSFCLYLGSAQQKSISITIDDVPNTTKYQKHGYRSLLLNLLDSLDVPFTIFINEDKIFKTDAVNRNKALLESWIKRDRALIGNHTYSHPRYSDVGLNSFIQDVEKGEILTKQYIAKYGKDLAYFRFPFNDLGKDSIQHTQIREYLKLKNYIIAPFTVESSDWMFDFVYQHYLDNGEIEKAKAIGKQYVEKTLAMVGFFDEMARSLYGRPVKHIYLCHDNAINADYLREIIAQLKQDDYKVVSFKESLTDPIYDQENSYYKKWGISWLYRWMDTQGERVRWMKQEPDLSEIQGTYQQILEN
ncbi:polysaccharide deacetylase [Allomuricauda ruestringensis DSM 13258]|uniref:Polysaccharide deacetylase n=1 Tax=Allomuricauda ruestringensis (strain DSM 13258 / CIP 107369 / LMG 19739 / B1) TaxID=886377 RepID=G2PIU8_ALLRU|nr:polysaccharide deacetylase family protein [Allomuricauda ruestringensis]AEM70747.1 polysaccharide deacetylase [Allomuricauda ruestringensis DSM 13258]